VKPEQLGTLPAVSLNDRFTAVMGLASGKQLIGPRRTRRCG